MVCETLHDAVATLNAIGWPRGSAIVTNEVGGAQIRIYKLLKFGNVGLEVLKGLAVEIVDDADCESQRLDTRCRDGWGDLTY